MKKLTTCILLVGSFLLSGSVFAQPLSGFLIPNHSPLVHNPAFAGALDKARASFTSNFARLSPIPSSEYQPTNFNLAWDQRIDRIKGGLGVSLSAKDESLVWGGKAEIMYSPKFELGSRWCLAPGLGLGMGFFQVDRDKFITSVPDPALGEGDTLSFYPDFRIGVLLNTSNFYLGLDLNHLLKPDVSVFRLVSYPGPLMRRLSLQTGFTLGFGKKSNFSLSNQAICAVDEDLWLQDFISLKYKFLIAGIGYAWNGDRSTTPLQGGFALMSLGVKTQKIKVAYTLAPSLNNTANFRFHVHEFSLIYYWETAK